MITFNGKPISELTLDEAIEARHEMVEALLELLDRELEEIEGKK